MKNIAIVGTGQAGLQLGFELLAKGYDVTIYSDQTPQEILNSEIMPAPIQFYPSLALEEKFLLNFWGKERDAQLDASCFSSYSPEGRKMLTINASLHVKAKSIDLRLKYAVWLEEFVRRKGKLVLQKESIDLLEHCTLNHDAVFVATGKNRFSSIFERDEERSLFKVPQRKLLLFYLSDCQFSYPHHPEWNTVYFFQTPGVGEFILFNTLHKSGKRVFSFLIEAIPNGPLDLFNKHTDGSIQLEILKGYAKKNHPDLYGLIKDAGIVDNEWMYGAITPEVKKPAGKLPSGRVVMAIGEALITYDHIGAQRLNADSKTAHYIADWIDEHKAARFNEQWINEVFEGYWKKARYNVLYESSLFNTTRRHQKLISIAASHIPEIASDLVNGMGDPRSLAPFYFEPAAAVAYLRENGFSLTAVK
jgi:hypothetical protein